jgi:hypothetical protein
MVVILKLPERYKETYQKDLNPASYGFKSVFEMVKSLKDCAEVYHHDVLRLWVAKYKEPVALGDGVVVDEAAMSPPPPEMDHEEATAEDVNGSEHILNEGISINKENEVVPIEVMYIVR